jgi:predicted nucleotidyltransferase
MSGAACPASVLASIRQHWLDDALPELIGDHRVAGLAFVGSLGRHDGDNWSDVDLLVVVHDAAFADFSDQRRNRLWAGADLLIDARQNAPAAATSMGALYVRSGLPLGVDWYVYRASMAVWPSDCHVLHDPVGRGPVDEPFAELNGRGPRRKGTVKPDGEVRLARLAMVPIAGKYVARGSAAAAAMIEFLGGGEVSVGAVPSEQLRVLRAIAVWLSTGSAPRIEAAVESYLGLVQSTIT